jgi:ketosteroid isomerase-like protein
MSEESVESVRSQYRAAARGEEPSLRWLDERVALDHGSVPDLPSVPEAVDEPRWRPERFVDLHGRVLVRVKLTGRTRETGQETETRLAHLWTIRRGEAVGLAVFPDWESGLEAAGLAE